MRGLSKIRLMTKENLGEVAGSLGGGTQARPTRQYSFSVEKYLYKFHKFIQVLGGGDILQLFLLWCELLPGQRT